MSFLHGRAYGPIDILVGYSKKDSHWSHHQFFLSSPGPITRPMVRYVGTL